MFIAHSPAGYLLSRKLSYQLANEKDNIKYLVLIGMIGSVFPDFDLLYFYLIDNRQHAHHTYWTHIPYFWLVLSALFMAIGTIINSRMVVLSIFIFTVNIFLHLILDTLFGGIYWLYPFERSSFVLVEIPSVYDWWVLNFVLHWSFMLELCIVAFAYYKYKTDGTVKELFQFAWIKQWAK